jgi:subtilase family serine protease
MGGKVSSFGFFAGCIALASIAGVTPALSGGAAGAAPAIASHKTVRACAQATAGHVACEAQRTVGVALNPATIGALGTIPYGPQTIKTAYGFPTSMAAGAGEKIAIVDAYDDRHIQADLAVFDTQMGLPPCTNANGCFLKMNQSGGTTTFPAVDVGWDMEISLDVEWAHAIAPGAKILLVEARDATLTNLMKAEDTAVAKASFVTNSWGGPEFVGENTLDHNFVRPGVSVFASAGDSGLPASWPSASPNLISVGGTAMLTNASGVTAFEAAWQLHLDQNGQPEGGGGGCSLYELATAAQKARPGYGFNTNCAGMRGTPDLSLDADPNTGYAVYDRDIGWAQFGGTSASSPIVAARAADTWPTTVFDANRVYGGGARFRDITNGSNGANCVPGYDLCTGMGSLIG